MIRIYGLSVVVTVICMVLAFHWGGWVGLYLALVLSILEVSLSFDNAVVNATVLRDMSRLWQQLFLTIGILIAVFGMRLAFPLIIVAVVGDITIAETADLALNDPDRYSELLTASHIQIAAFGGVFLLLVFLNYFIDDEKDTHWFHALESRVGGLGRVESITIIIALLSVVALQASVPEAERLSCILSGLTGILLYAIVNSLDTFLQTGEDAGQGSGVSASEIGKRSGVMGFLYLELLDASFSFDGVIGAFAITKDVVIIMLGLAVGAMFVRSMTVHLVRRGTLEEYIYLEHGAHYAIGALAIIMLTSAVLHIPEWITGLIGVAFIALALMSSVMHKKRLAQNSAA
jgi:hypothetical protein